RHTRCLSDWSSDVCSSDLGREETAHGGADSASTTGDHRSMPVQHAHGGDPVTSTAPACRSTLTSMDQDDLRQRLADERNRLESEIGRASCRERVEMTWGGG